MTPQSLVICATAYVSVGCARILGIEDLPELTDASTPAVDASMRDAITCMPDEGMSFCYGPGYPMFPPEGEGYPEDMLCSGAFKLNQRLIVTYQGHEVTLSYFSLEDCGSFAKIENAPTNCAAVLERSTDDGVSWAWVGEIVEPHLDYAYTMIGNNLDGRKSRAALACDGQVLERTGWHGANSLSLTDLRAGAEK